MPTFRFNGLTIAPGHAEIDAPSRRKALVRAQNGDFDDIQADGDPNDITVNDSRWLELEKSEPPTNPDDHGPLGGTLRLEGHIRDLKTDNLIGFRLTLYESGIGLHVHGFGQQESSPGSGDEILLEIDQGVPVLSVWSNIRRSEPTHTVDLANAKESLRKGD